MKKILTILAISFSALMASSVSTAAPHDKQDRSRGWDHPRHQESNKIEISVRMMTMSVCKINAVVVKNVA